MFNCSFFKTLINTSLRFYSWHLFKQVLPTFISLYIQNDRRCKLYKTPYIAPLWRKFLQSESILKLHNHTSEDLWLIFVKVNAQFSLFYSYSLSHKTVIFMRNAKVWSGSSEDTSRASFAKGCLSSSPTSFPPATDEDRLIVNCFCYSILTCALLQELHRDQCKSLLISMKNFICIMKWIV